MRIRKFRKSDAGKVSDLIIRAQRGVLSRHYPKHVIDYFCRRSTPEYILKKSKVRDYYVAVEGGRILGVNGIQGNEVRLCLSTQSTTKKESEGN